MITPWDAIYASKQRPTSCRPIRSETPPRRRQTASEAAADPPQRHILPKDLPSAIKHLSDGELDFLHAATLEEMKRRGRMPPGVETDLQTLRHRLNVHPDLMKIKSPPTKKRHGDSAQVSLTRGQVNAVRAAFKAGITPSRIARQFGISQSNVRKALASDESKR